MDCHQAIPSVPGSQALRTSECARISVCREHDVHSTHFDDTSVGKRCLFTKASLAAGGRRWRQSQRSVPAWIWRRDGAPSCACRFSPLELTPQTVDVQGGYYSVTAKPLQGLNRCVQTPMRRDAACRQQWMWQLFAMECAWHFVAQAPFLSSSSQAHVRVRDTRHLPGHADAIR